MPFWHIVYGKNTIFPRWYEQSIGRMRTTSGWNLTRRLQESDNEEVDASKSSEKAENSGNKSSINSNSEEKKTDENNSSKK